MNALNLDRADTYLNSEWRESRAPWTVAKTAPPFITISREAGSGGSSLARLLARTLQSPTGVMWRVFEGDVTVQMLQANQLSPHLARFLPEDRVSELHSSIGELVGLHPNLYDLVQKTNETIRNLATGGHVILVGRGANFACAGLDHGLHLRLVAPPAHRARYLAQMYNLPLDEAETLNGKCEAARRRYVKTTFDADVADPAAYDLTLNTAQMSLREAAHMISTVIQRRGRTGN